MKKILPFAVVCLFASMASCKKDYNCFCYYSTDGVTDRSTNSTIHDTKKNAEQTCTSGNKKEVFGGKILAVNCSIK